MDKTKTLEDAVGAIEDGMTIGIGGWGPRRKPLALVRELIRQGQKDLTVVAYGGADVGMLCAAGQVKKVVFAFVSLDFMPLEPGFRAARQAGVIEVREIDEGMMLLGLRAAAWRLPFIPTAIGLGTDVIRNNPDLALIDSPYDDKQWVAMPALNLDVALLHASIADHRGVCAIQSPDHYMDDLFARAAKYTIVSTDELVDSDIFRDASIARQVLWERNVTDAVVTTQAGAHPSSNDPRYGYDVKQFQAYAEAVSSGQFAAYREQVIGASETQYLANAGGVAAIHQLPLPVY